MTLEGFESVRPRKRGLTEKVNCNSARKPSTLAIPNPVERNDKNRVHPLAHWAEIPELKCWTIKVVISFYGKHVRLKIRTPVLRRREFLKILLFQHCYVISYFQSIFDTELVQDPTHTLLQFWGEWLMFNFILLFFLVKSKLCNSRMINTGILHHY